MITRWAVRALYAGVLVFSIGLPPATAAAPEGQNSTTVATPPDTLTVRRIATITLEEGRIIAVEAQERVLLGPGDSVVVSIEEESDPGSRWEIVAIPPLALGWREDWRRISVEAIHPDSVVLLNCDATYGLYCRSIKVFFDAEAKQTLGRVEIEPLGKSALLEINNAIYAVTEWQKFARNQADHIVARYAPGEPALASGSEREAVIAALPTPPPRCRSLKQSPILEGGLLDPAVTPLARPSCFVQVASSPPLWLFDFPIYNNDDLRGIAAQDGDSYPAYPLPQSTPEDLRLQLRTRYPEASNPDYMRDIGQYSIEERIGAFALHANRLWLGKAFYDGEGHTGVGSFGYFDVDRGRYKLIRLPEIADWSTSAILIEESSVWIGLAHYTEGADGGGGLLRYDRRTGETRIYPIENIITQVLHHNGAIYVGAERGRFYVIKEGSIVSRYSVEPALKGGFEIRSLSQTQ